MMADKEKSADPRSAKRPKARAEATAPRPDRTRSKQSVAPGNDKGARKPSPVVASSPDLALRSQGWLEEFKAYLKGVRKEFDRITWPAREKLTTATVAVLVMLVMTSIFLAAVNIGLEFIFSKMMSAR